MHKDADYRYLNPAPVDRTSASTNTHGKHVRKNVKHINDPRSLRIKATFSSKVIHAHETGWQSDMRLFIMSGLPMHLVEELNVGTVDVGFHFSGGWLLISLGQRSILPQAFIPHVFRVSH